MVRGFDHSPYSTLSLFPFRGSFTFREGGPVVSWRKSAVITLDFYSPLTEEEAALGMDSSRRFEIYRLVGQGKGTGGNLGRETFQGGVGRLGPDPRTRRSARGSVRVFFFFRYRFGRGNEVRRVRSG